MVQLDSVTVLRSDGKLAIFPHVCAGENRALVVCISIRTNILQEVQSVAYAGIPLSRVTVAQIRSDTRTEVWVLANPPQGSSNVECLLTRAGEAIYGAVSVKGVRQDTPVYFSESGVGQGVDKIPLLIDIRNGAMIIGVGTALGDAQANVESWQTELWNQLDGIRGQCLASFPNFTAKATVANTINKPADWSVILLGLEPV